MLATVSVLSNFPFKIILKLPVFSWSDTRADYTLDTFERQHGQIEGEKSV